MTSGEMIAAAESVVDPQVDENPARFVPTGSTLLNLACSGSRNGGLLVGKYHLCVGDASAGKTFLAVSCLAEACLNPTFDDYRLIYDNVEDGCLFDLKSLFHAELERRLEPPAVDTDSMPMYSSTVEELYFNLDDAVKEGKPFIYVLDSMDALTSDEEDKKFDKNKRAVRGGKDATGSYGTNKARQNSQGLRKVLRDLRRTDSMLLILSQTRANLGWGFNKKTRSGGHALRFYATLELWASVVGTIKKNIRGSSRQLGVSVEWKVKKNRVLGALYEVGFDIYPQYGIDDIGSCIDYLVSEKWWPQRGNKINARSLDLVLVRHKLIRIIEKRNLVRKLRREVEKCWHEIERAARPKRKPKYSEDLAPSGRELAGVPSEVDAAG